MAQGGFAAGLTAGVNAARGGIDIYRSEQDRQEELRRRQELQDVANAKVEDAVMPLTPNDDEGNAMPSKGITFLGKTYDKSPTDTEQNSARNLAMAGVIKKYNPAEGMRLEQGARQGDREEKAYQREEEWRKGREDLLQNSNFGQIQRANAQAKSAYDTALAQHKANTEAGQPELAAPQAPQTQDYGYAQSLLDNLTVAAHDVKYGKAQPDALSHLAKLQKDLQDEGYSKALKIAQGGGDAKSIVDAFNAGGNVKLDPNAIVGDQMVDKGNGVKSRMLTLKNPDGSTRTIDTLSELDALDKADKVYSRVFATNADTRHGEQTKATVGHLNAQTGVLGQTLSDKKELGTIRTELNDAIDTGDAESIATGRAKLLNYMMSGKSGTQGMTAEERKANFYLASGMAKTMAEAGRMAHEKVQTSPKDDFLLISKPNSMGIAPTEANVDQIMSTMHGANWKQKLGPSQGAAPEKPADQASAHTQAQAAIQGGADKAAINARLKQWGYPPLP